MALKVVAKKPVTMKSLLERHKEVQEAAAKQQAIEMRLRQSARQLEQKATEADQRRRFKKDKWIRGVAEGRIKVATTPYRLPSKKEAEKMENARQARIEAKAAKALERATKRERK